MAEDSGGGPAFPGRDLRRASGSHDGMDLRDWFAGQAVAVMPGDVADPEGIANDAYLIADAMIRRRRIAPPSPADEDES